MTERKETVVLVAFVVETNGDENPQHRLQERLHPLLRMNDETSPIDSWWVAEDDRMDGSDNDSAVFVTPGRQAEASALLYGLGLTGVCNVVKPRGGQFAPSDTRGEVYPGDRIARDDPKGDVIDLLDDPWGLND